MGKITENKILNIPNIISVLRLVFIVPLIGYFYLKEKNIAATALGILFILTDILDGLLARKFKQVTNLGVYLDATVDNIMAATVAFSFLYLGYFTWPLIALVAAHRFTRLLLALFIGMYGHSYYFPNYIKLTILFPAFYVLSVPFLADFIKAETLRSVTFCVIGISWITLAVMIIFAILRFKKGKLKMTQVERLKVKQLLKKKI